MIDTPPTPSGEGPIAAVSDEDLLRRHLAGESDAFRQLVERHQQWLYGYLLNQTRSPETARDLFQEVFLRVARGASQFAHRSRFSSWLFAIGSNVLRDHRRRHLLDRVRGFVAAGIANSMGAESGANPGPSDLGQLESVPDPRPGPDREYEGRERLARVCEALAELPEKQRRVLLLVKVEGMSLQETSSLLSLKVNTVKTLLRRGRLGLARRLVEGEGT